LAGDNESALGGIPAAAIERSKSPMDTLTRKSGAAMASVSTKEWDEADVSNKKQVRNKSSKERNTAGPRTRIGRKQVDSDNVTDQDASGKESQAAGDQDLRKKIEALRGEVGDDWLRLLARGESVYVPREDDEARA
jgi:hypothetical protein